MVLPSAVRTGRARSKACGDPPAMMASVASRAPSTPPLTGQSRKSAPHSASNFAAVDAVSELTVEQSTTSEPGERADASAPTTSITSLSAETHATTASTPEASSVSVDAALQPSSAASALAFPSVRFQTARSEEHTSELQSQSNLVCRLLL